MADLVNAEYEILAIGIPLANPDLYERMAEHVRPEDFSDPVLGVIFDRIGEMRASNKDVTAVTLYQACRDLKGLEELGGARFIANAGVSGVTAQFGWEGIATDLADLAKRRRAVEALETTIARMREYQVKTAQAAAVEIEQALLSLSDNREASAISTAAECIRQIVIENLEAQSGNSPGIILQHFTEWSEIVGPMMPTEFTVLAGRPGMGKTGVGMKIATSAARQGEGVLYLSQEMSRPEIMRRGVADLLFNDRPDDIPYYRFTNMSLDRGQLRRVEQLGDRIAKWPLHIDEKAGHTLSTIANLARRTQRQFERDGKKLKLLIVDHLHLMGSDERNTNDYSKATANSRGLKRLAKDLDCHVLALCQMSRKCEEREDKRPQMSDLRDTGAIEEDANNVVMLYRHEYYLEKQKVPGKHDASLEAQLEEWRGILELLGRKVRNGGPRDTRVYYNTFYQSFRSMQSGDPFPLAAE